MDGFILLPVGGVSRQKRFKNFILRDPAMNAD